MAFRGACLEFSRLNELGQKALRNILAYGGRW